MQFVETARSHIHHVCLKVCLFRFSNLENFRFTLGPCIDSWTMNLHSTVSSPLSFMSTIICVSCYGMSHKLNQSNNFLLTNLANQCNKRRFCSETYDFSIFVRTSILFNYFHAFWPNSILNPLRTAKPHLWVVLHLIIIFQQIELESCPNCLQKQKVS